MSSVTCVHPLTGNRDPGSLAIEAPSIAARFRNRTGAAEAEPDIPTSGLVIAPELSLVIKMATSPDKPRSTKRTGPTLSVVVPVYNEREHIAETLREAGRVAAEAGFDAQFIVVDDGSTDGSGEV